LGGLYHFFLSPAGRTLVGIIAGGYCSCERNRVEQSLLLPRPAVVISFDSSLADKSGRNIKKWMESQTVTETDRVFLTGERREEEVRSFPNNICQDRRTFRLQKHKSQHWKIEKS